jgi:hypothetical protein
MIGNKQMGTNHLDQQNHGPCKEIQVMKHGKCGDHSLIERSSLTANFGNVSVHGNSSTSNAFSMPVINHLQKCYGII